MSGGPPHSIRDWGDKGCIITHRDHTAAAVHAMMEATATDIGDEAGAGETERVV